MKEWSDYGSSKPNSEAHEEYSHHFEMNKVLVSYLQMKVAMRIALGPFDSLGTFCKNF